ncbi:MAG: hypothetical protein AAGB31_11950 [Bdellovibrio sp.]
MKTNILLSLAISILSTTAYAGPSTGGGGFVVSCPATPVSPASVELLDIYEGKSSLGFQMAVASGNLAEDHYAGTDRTYSRQGYPGYADQIRSQIMNNLTRFMQSSKFVSTAGELPKANDLGVPPWIPSQCQILQVAYFDDLTHTIFILKPLFDRMDSVNQAALAHHELMYREYRRTGELTSENSRSAVAQIYAVNGPIPINKGVAQDTPQFVASPNVFSAIQNKELNITRLQFSHVNGIGQFSKTWADFPKMIWSFKLGRSAENPEFVGCILQTSGTNQQYSANLNGVATKGYTLNLRVKTGEPIKMTLLKDGVLMSEEFVRGGINCSAALTE